jgi:hypothetical protein
VTGSNHKEIGTKNAIKIHKIHASPKRAKAGGFDNPALVVNALVE